MRKIRVLNISGWGRSGSTILGSVLGEVEGFFFGGEIRNLWNRVLIENRICGEGIPIKESKIWNDIFNEAFGGFEKINPNEMRKLLLKHTRNRHLPLMLLPGFKKYFKSNLSEYINNLAKLYLAINKVSNSNVIVDSSKSAAYSYVLSLVDEIELYVVHLVRDPRGVNYSHKKLKVHAEGSDGNLIYMKQFNPLFGSIVWDVRNVASELLFKRGNYLIIRYEDFVSEPLITVNKILNFINEPNAKTSFVSDRGVQLNTNYAVWGNPSRFKTGIVEIKSDDEWKIKMSTLDKFISTVLTFPLLCRYNYKVVG